MAPASGSSRSRRSVASKQPVKPVVPALPLPYVKRSQAAAAAAAAAAANVAAAHSPPLDAADEQQTINGLVPQEAKEAVRHSPASGMQHPAESKACDGLQLDSSSRAGTETNGHRPSAGKSQPVANEPSEPATASADDGSAKAQAADDPIQRPSPDGLFETSATLNGNGGAAGREPEHRPVVDQRPANVVNNKSRPPPALSPTGYQMLPPFQPAGRPLGIMGNGDVPRGPRPHPHNGPHHIHQAHASNGSIHFGTFHGSQSSSPAPPHSGGIAPPPGIAGPDGRPTYVGHPAGNGFPPMMPYGTDMVQVAHFDSYGRPAVGYGPMDPYAPYGNNFGPSTPRSFHGSQSSMHPEDNGVMYGQYPPGSARNGGAVPGDDIHPQNPQRRMFLPPEYPRMMPNMGPPPMMAHGNDGDGIVGYLQQQFASPELADCTLELRYSDDRARPVRIAGHRLIFSRSSELSALVRKQTMRPTTSDGALQTLLLETDSKWMRSDSFYMAVQHLYGRPLLPVPPPHRPEAGDVVEAGCAREQFEFSLSYAAAGRLLDWPPVTRRGCEVATQLLSWQTMEKGLEFALDGYSDSGSHVSYRYGEGSRAILNATVTFVMHNFPPSFNLDTLAEEPEHYARLPAHAAWCPTPTTASSTPTTEGSKCSPSPTIARGSSVQLGKGRRSQQIVNIQFGDLSLAESKNGPETETPKATRQAQPVSHGILSRVLLNLPFAQLKMILESSGSGNVNGWANTETRDRVIKRAVKEREARRLGALQAVVSGRVPGSDAIRTALRSPSPREMGRWSALGWQEEMSPHGNGDGPLLSRQWVPLREPQDGCATEYP